MSLGCVFVKSPEDRLKQIKKMEEEAMKPTKIEDLELGSTFPVSALAGKRIESIDFTISANEPVHAEINYKEIMKPGSFTFTTTMTSTEDIMKAMGNMAPGKPVIISGNCTNVEGPKPEPLAWVVDNSLPGNYVYATASRSPRTHDFPEMEPERGEYRAVYRINSHGSVAITTESRIQPGQVVSWSPELFKFPSIETIMKDIREMKKKYDKWITFEEKTGHWNRTVVKAMSGDKRAIKKMQDLECRAVCMLGKAWDGNPVWNSDDKETPCSACERLGTDLLRMFTEPGRSGYGYYPTVMERYEEYKLMFEWHWNNAHAGH